MAAVHVPYSVAYGYLLWRGCWPQKIRRLQWFMLTFWLTGVAYHACVAMTGDAHPLGGMFDTVRVVALTPLIVWCLPLMRYKLVLPLLPTIEEFERLQRESRIRDEAIAARNAEVTKYLDEIRDDVIRWGHEADFIRRADHVRELIHKIRGIYQVDTFQTAVRRLRERQAAVSQEGLWGSRQQKPPDTPPSQSSPPDSLPPPATC